MQHDRQLHEIVDTATQRLTLQRTVKQRSLQVLQLVEQPGGEHGS